MYHRGIFLFFFFLINMMSSSHDVLLGLAGLQLVVAAEHAPGVHAEDGLVCGKGGVEEMAGADQHQH